MTSVKMFNDPATIQSSVEGPQWPERVKLAKNNIRGISQVGEIRSDCGHNSNLNGITETDLAKHGCALSGSKKMLSPV